MSDLDVTREEVALIEHIHTALEMFMALPRQRATDVREFGIVCQRLQDFVASRASYRRITAERNVPKN